MPSSIDINGARIRYQLDGPVGAPVLILSNSLGTTLEMWDVNLPSLTQRFRVLRYDTRGHGGSQTTAGEYSLDVLGHDVLSLADALGIGDFHFCGLSMGGLIGQWLGVNAGPRVNKLILCNTAAKIGSADGWNSRIDMVKHSGMGDVAAGAIARWFTPEFAEREPGQVEQVHQQLLGCDPAGYAANCAAVRDADFREHLHRIAMPLLFIAGSRDPVTTVAEGEVVVDGVAHGRLLAVDAAHLSNIGAREVFDAAVIDFLND